MLLPKDLQKARPLLRSVTSEALAPDPDLLVSEWADKFRQLSSKASARPGQWRTDVVPYMREIMDAMSLSHPCADGDFKKGTQIAGSEGLYNAIGYTVDLVPCPIMLVMPTVDTAKTISQQRLQPMIDDTPPLAKKLGTQKSRDTSNTTLRKDFPGGMLLLRGANSGPGLRNVPVRVLLMDEIDAYPDDVDGEGDPCVLAEKRTESFGARAKRFTCSSPKIRGKSRIDRRYNRGTRALYYVPCPHCHHEQWLKWQQVRWEMEKRRELICGDCGTITEYHGAAPTICPHCEVAAKPGTLHETATDDVAEAWYECEACTGRIDEHHKTSMLERGRHIHAAPGIGEVLADDDPNPHAIWAWLSGKVCRFLPRYRRPLSWHVSALYSPLGWFSWRKAVMQFLEAQKGGYNEETGETLAQVFDNTVLGESYEIKGEQPEHLPLKLRAEPYALATVPAGALLLLAGVDMQGDRLEIKVKGYGRGQESWLIDYQRIYYAPGAKRPSAAEWDQLIALRDKAYQHAGGQTLRITAMLVDSGYLTQEAYDFCRKWSRKHVIATKGLSQRGKAILGRPTLQDVNHNGKMIKAGVQLWPIGTDTGKELVYTRLGIREPGPGYMHFPRELPDEYYEQLTAEKRVPRRVRGVEINEWIKTRERNEALDLEILCQAAFIYAGGQRINWDQLEQVINPEQRDLFAAPVKRPAPAAQTVESPPAAAPAIPAAADPVAAGAPVPVQTSAPRKTWLPRRDNWLRR
jgi:phage terminase large subunit GpA-like protein